MSHPYLPVYTSPITLGYNLYRIPVDFRTYDPDPDGSSLHLTPDSNAYAVLEFLASHPDQGFTPKEITEATGVPRGSVGTTLSRLRERDLVRHKEPYWAIGDDDRLGAYSAMKHGLETAEDREDDWGDWEETAVDPRTGHDENGTE